jgi:isopropylmalate/homocitrate/citramalate synthase/ubiquinone/menaquinone biosynthesis C-methylase UbiE
MMMSSLDKFYQQHFHDDLSKIPESIVKEFFQPEREFLLRKIPVGASVLDVGCGDGRVLEELIEKTCKLFGIDKSDKQLELLKAKFPQFKIAKMDAEDMAFPDNTFDCTICTFNTLGNFNRPILALQEMNRITRPGGSVIATVYSKAALDSQLELYKLHRLNVKNVDGNQVELEEGLISRRYNEDQIRQLFQDAGFKVDVVALSPIAYGCVVQKQNNTKIEKIKLYDETLRDGEQQVGVVFSAAEKKILAKKIAGLGVDFIDIMIGVHPDEDALVSELIAEGIPIAPACMMNEQYVEEIRSRGVKKTILFYSVSDILLKTRGKTREEAINLICTWAKKVHELGIQFDFAAEDATRADYGFLVEVAKGIKPYVEHFMICDTVGCMQPSAMKKLIQDFKMDTGCAVGVHCHNDLGLAVENTVQAVLGGASLVSGTFTGIGERAGNACLEQVLKNLKDRYGIISGGLDYDQLDALVEQVRELAVIGPAKPNTEQAFRSQTGIHISSLLMDESSYCIFPGVKHTVWFGKYSGISNFKYLFERELNTPLPHQTYEEMRNKIKNMSISQKKTFNSQEVISMHQRGEL